MNDRMAVRKSERTSTSVQGGGMVNPCGHRIDDAIHLNGETAIIYTVGMLIKKNPEICRRWLAHIGILEINLPRARPHCATTPAQPVARSSARYSGSAIQGASDRLVHGATADSWDTASAIVQRSICRTLINIGGLNIRTHRGPFSAHQIIDICITLHAVGTNGPPSVS